MSYRLIGSYPSPFVRRTRILLSAFEYEFVAINYMEKEGAELLKGRGPINKIPILIDGDQMIYDSRVIFNHLNKKHFHWDFGVEEENLLSVIDAGLDSQINLFMLKRSGIDIDAAQFYPDRQKERIEAVLKYIEEWLENEIFLKWTYPSICLYSWLDWMKFRELMDLSQRHKLNQFMSRFSNLEAVKKTAPGHP